MTGGDGTMGRYRIMRNELGRGGEGAERRALPDESLTISEAALIAGSNPAPGPASFMAAERAANDERDRRLREQADPECCICRGRGKSANWVAQGYAYHPCICTGEAAWQKAAE